MIDNPPCPVEFITSITKKNSSTQAQTKYSTPTVLETKRGMAAKTRQDIIPKRSIQRFENLNVRSALGLGQTFQVRTTPDFTRTSIRALPVSVEPILNIAPTVRR